MGRLRQQLQTAETIAEPIGRALRLTQSFAQRMRQTQPEQDRQKRYLDRKSTRLNSSHVATSYAVFCLKKKRAGVDEHGLLTVGVGEDYRESELEDAKMNIREHT